MGVKNGTKKLDISYARCNSITRGEEKCQKVQQCEVVIAKIVRNRPKSVNHGRGSGEVQSSKLQNPDPSKFHQTHHYATSSFENYMKIHSFCCLK